MDFACGASQIIVSGLEFYGYHGVYDWEHDVGTRFRADLVADIEPGLAGFETDRLDDTINYELMASIIVDEGTRNRYALIERLAQAICTRMLALEGIRRVDLTISKFVVGMVPGDGVWMGVRRVLEAVG